MNWTFFEWFEFIWVPKSLDLQRWRLGVLTCWLKLNYIFLVLYVDMNTNELRFASLKVLIEISPIWSIKLPIWMNKILFEYFEFIWMPRSLNLRKWRFWVTFHQSGGLRCWLEWIGHSLNGLNLLNAKELNLQRWRFWILFLQYEELSCWREWILPYVNDLSSFEC